MVEGAPVMHEGELIGFIKREYETARLIEVILAHEPEEQIDLKTLEGSLGRLPKPYKTLHQEAAGLLDADSVLVSTALANSVAIPFLKPVMKTLVPVEMFKPVSGTECVLQIDVSAKDLTLGIEDRLAGIPGLAGEWFAGKVDGIIIRRKRTLEVPIRIGTTTQSTGTPDGCLTIFDLNIGLKSLKTLVNTSIPIIYGDAMLLDGVLDEKKLMLRTKLVFIIRSREMWVLD